MKFFIYLILVFGAFISMTSCDKLIQGKDAPNPERKFGLKKSSSSTLAVVPLATRRTYAGVLPKKHILTMPPVADQGTEGSCVAFAVAYTTRSYQLGTTFFDVSGNQNTKNLMSPEYLFNQIKVGDCDGGSYFVTTGQYAGALDKMKSEGVCSLFDMAYSSENGCDLQPTAYQRKQAMANRIERFERVNDLSTANMKVLLLNNLPIIIGAEVDDNFVNANADFIWKQKGVVRGNHAMVICGYDDSKNAFRIINQWGESWGDDGYTWLDYNLVQSVIFEAYITYPMNDKGTMPTTEGVWQGFYSGIDKPNIYGSTSQFIQNGVLKLNASASPYSYFWTGFNLNIPSNRIILGDNMRLEIRARNNSWEGGISAYDIGLHLIGDKQNLSMSFMGEAWAQYWANVSVGSMSYPNLAEMVQKLDNYVTLVMETKNGQMIISYEGRELRRINYGGTIGNIAQIALAFKGSGSCDWIRVYQNGALRMRDEFNTNGTSNIEWF